MPELVQILPPMTQSKEEMAACWYAYVSIFIRKIVTGSSVPSERGQDIHTCMAKYVDHCAAKRVPSDWIAFNQLASAAGPEAGPILDGLRDSYVVDWEHVFATEVPLGVDANFRPAASLISGDERYPMQLPRIVGVDYSEDPAAYVGRLDVIRFSGDGTRGDIDDFKSTPGIFEPDDKIQAPRYAFMLFVHFPALETVTFNLIFVRYRNCVRSKTYHRTQMPELQAAMSRAITRQRIAHDAPDQAEALPNDMCQYCPHMRDLTCPQMAINPYMAMPDSERLKQLHIFRQAAKYHTPILKTAAQVHGSVEYADGNGVSIKFVQKESSVTKIALTQDLIDKLDAYSAKFIDDQWTDWRLAVKSTELKSKLKANKKKPARAGLESELYAEGYIDGSETKPKWGIQVGEAFEPESNSYSEE
jgi:hypothetical protein